MSCLTEMIPFDIALKKKTIAELTADCTHGAKKKQIYRKNSVQAISCRQRKQLLTGLFLFMRIIPTRVT